MHGLVGSLPLDAPPRKAQTAQKGTKKALAVNAKCLICIACLVGRGNLNPFTKPLIYGVKRHFNFQLEYQLEYRSVENCFAQDYSEFPVEDRMGKKWSLPVMSRIFICGNRLCSRQLKKSIRVPMEEVPSLMIS